MEIYTLYFKINNKYGHEKNVPIITLDLKSMDEFTGVYRNYLELFSNLPDELKEFISKEIHSSIDLNDEKQLEDCFFIASSKEKKSFVLLANDLDVIYIKPEELTELIVKQRLNFTEIGRNNLKSNISSTVKKRYEFFEYLYETYVKNKKIIGMMDTYDISEKLPMLSGDKLMIAAIATDKDNIIVLSKKIGQKSKDRRNLAFMFKKLILDIDNINLINMDLIEIRKKDKMILELKDIISSNYNTFKTEYYKEYE